MKTKKLSKQGSIIILVLAIMLLWELLSLVAHLSNLQMVEQRIPYLHLVFAELISNFPSLFLASLNTLATAATGFLIGTVVGYAFAIIMHRWFTAERIILPYLIILQMIPALALAPIIFSIVKDSDLSRIIISAFMTFFPVAVNTLNGMKSVEKNSIDLMQTYGASTSKMYSKLILWRSLPGLFAGLKISAPRSITAAILVEMLGTTNGIGIKMLYCLYYGERNANLFWACVLMSVLLGVGSYILVSFFESKLTHWNREQ